MRGDGHGVSMGEEMGEEEGRYVRHVSLRMRGSMAGLRGSTTGLSS